MRNCGYLCPRQCLENKTLMWVPHTSLRREKRESRADLDVASTVYSVYMSFQLALARKVRREGDPCTCPRSRQKSSSQGGDKSFSEKLVIEN
ncbi:unnamed protein product [Trichogramma brassicae]|uniref:Uncharacterized protein n=1 Tax=Trichogramma brassicae TaxID=86971 RepID=A0A6H5I6D7_9HYME|nr:unnamed protein product [Trichogramma brassicae]